jgi:nitroreductase
MDLFRIIANRRSVKKFKSRRPNWRKIIEAIDYAKYSPMAGGNFSLKFILVSNKEKINKIADAAQQDFIKKVSYVVVFCSDSKRTENLYGKRSERYLRQQAGAAIQNFLLAIERNGLSTCWVGHFVDNQIKSVLNIPEDIEVEAVFPIGHAYEKPKRRKVERNLDNLLYFDSYNNKKMKEIKTVDV